MTHDLACSSFKCLENSHEGKGAFARYTESGGARIVGIVSCAGCPTLIAPEKIVSRVRTLVASGIDAIHFAACLEKLCPFKKRYKQVLKENFPEVKFIDGTHEKFSDEEEAALGRLVCEGLGKSRLTMADWMESRKRPVNE
jgi:predicted metal-binding protein